MNLKNNYLLIKNPRDLEATRIAIVILAMEEIEGHHTVVKEAMVEIEMMETDIDKKVYSGVETEVIIKIEVVTKDVILTRVVNIMASVNHMVEIVKEIKMTEIS